MTPSAGTTAREQIFLNLAPFFLEAAHGNHADARAAARAAAEAMVDSFGPESTEQTLLAAQIVVYSLAGLDSLRRSAEAPDLAPSVHLRLRGNANAMQRASQQCRKALDMRRKTGATASADGAAANPTSATPVRTFTEDDLKAAIQSASAVIAEARAAAQTPMNREARRAAEREARRSVRAH
jgi:hypothetical protein